MKKSRSKKKNKRNKSPLLSLVVLIICIFIGIITINVIRNNISSKEEIVSIEENQNQGVSRDILKIKVLNCTKINGLAGSVEENLKKKGYSKIDVSNGQEREKTQVLIREEKARVFIKNDFPCDNIIKGIAEVIDKDQQYDIVIFLGKDYKKIGESE